MVYWSHQKRRHLQQTEAEPRYPQSYSATTTSILWPREQNGTRSLSKAGIGRVCTRPGRTRATKEKMARCSQERLCWHGPDCLVQKFSRNCDFHVGMFFSDSPYISHYFPNFVLLYNITVLFSTYFFTTLPNFAPFTYRIYSHISRKINDKIMPQKLGGGRLFSGSILARCLDLLLRLSWNVIIAHWRRRSHLVQPSPALLLKVDQCVLWCLLL